MTSFYLDDICKDLVGKVIFTATVLGLQQILLRDTSQPITSIYHMPGTVLGTVDTAVNKSLPVFSLCTIRGVV